MEGLRWEVLSPKLGQSSFPWSSEASMSLYSSQNKLVSKQEPLVSISGSHALLQVTFGATAQYGQHPSRD